MDSKATALAHKYTNCDYPISQASTNYRRTNGITGDDITVIITALPTSAYKQQLQV